MVAASAPAPPRPPLDTPNALDAPILSVTLGPDGIASLPEDGLGRAPDTGNGVMTPMTRAKTEEIVTEPASAGEEDESSDDAIEDYDELEVDPDTLVASSRKSMDANFRPAAGGKDGSTSEETDGDCDGGRHNRGSVQIRLEKTGRKGRYVLMADDPAIREILGKGIEREEALAGNKKSRVRFRDLVFTRQFTAFDRQNPATAETPFFGFFTLFWICIGWSLIQVGMRNWREYGNVLGQNQVMRMMFSHDVYVLGITDGVMCASTAVTYLLQLLVFRGYISWSKTGWILQNLWQSAYLGGVVGWAYFREWPWTHTIFAALHGLVFLMKQHSYSFYNGYLSAVYRRRALLERKLSELRTLDPVESAPDSPHIPLQFGEFSTAVDVGEKARTSSADLDIHPVRRRPSMGPRTSTNLAIEKSDMASVVAAIGSGQPIDYEQMQTFEGMFKLEIDDLSKELQGKSPEGKNAYPGNLRLSNFAEFICLPTLVYELEYPRQENINWWYVAEKAAATLGVLAIMMAISQAYIYPPVAKTVRMKEAGMPIDERWREFPWIVSDILFPLLIEQLLTWYLIWECILNLVAELTCFADRGFYGDWWNSVTWDQYARDWNRPVHNFLLRHVYHSSISTFHLSRTAATFVTFLLSALVHEMCMAIIFKKVRGYLFWSQLLQMPLVMLSRSKLLKGRVILGNVIFWVGLFVGPSFLTGLYLVI